jgi:hypothetical protein
MEALREGSATWRFSAKASMWAAWARAMSEVQVEVFQVAAFSACGSG